MGHGRAGVVGLVGAEVGLVRDDCVVGAVREPSTGGPSYLADPRIIATSGSAYARRSLSQVCRLSNAASAGRSHGSAWCPSCGSILPTRPLSHVKDEQGAR